MDWEYFGRNDPYWAVVTHDRFRREQFDSGARQDFFESGERHMDWVFRTVRAHLDPRFSPRRALDFGCGVGRLVLPLARRCPSVVGVDVSESMLREADDNSRGFDNVTLVKGDDQLSAVSGSFDLVNTYIVLQHIPPRRGRHLFRRLVELLGVGGVGVIHLTYAVDTHASYAEFGEASWPPAPPPPVAPPDGIRHHLGGLRRATVRRLSKLLGGREKVTGELGPNLPPVPVMQMNSYALNPLFHILQSAGVRGIYAELTNHGGPFGLVLFFRKLSDAPYNA